MKFSSSVTLALIVMSSASAFAGEVAEKGDKDAPTEGHVEAYVTGIGMGASVATFAGTHYVVSKRVKAMEKRINAAPGADPEPIVQEASRPYQARYEELANRYSNLEKELRVVKGQFAEHRGGPVVDLHQYQAQRNKVMQLSSELKILAKDLEASKDRVNDVRKFIMEGTDHRRLSQKDVKFLTPFADRANTQLWRNRKIELHADKMWNRGHKVLFGSIATFVASPLAGFAARDLAEAAIVQDKQEKPQVTQGAKPMDRKPAVLAEDAAAAKPFE